MTLLFKASGLILILAVCSAVGFSKSRELKKRAERLSRLARSLGTLSEYIRADKSEIDSLIKRCFEDNTVYFTEGRIYFDKSFLNAEDISLLEEFSVGFGKADADGEYERTHMYAVIVEKQLQAAEDICRRLCGLYNTLGVLCGIFICIYLI